MIPADCEKKIREMAKADYITQGFVDLFTAVANDSRLKENPSGTLIVPMYDESSGLQVGDYACELHFVVRRVEE